MALTATKIALTTQRFEKHFIFLFVSQVGNVWLLDLADYHGMCFALLILLL